MINDPLDKTFSRKNSNILLWALLGIDFVFILIHLLMKLNIVHLPGKFWLDWEGGYAEMFQYLKYSLIILFCLYLVLAKKRHGYLSWLFLFFILLLDDSLEFHERIGSYLVSKFDLQPALGLRALDFGELAYSAIAGGVLCIVLGLAFYKGSERFRKTSLDIILLFFLLLLFGIGVDMLHSLLQGIDIITSLFVIIEDGGEMLALSLIVWYFYFTVLGDLREGPYLYAKFFPSIKVNGH